jgi:transposase
MITKLDVRLKGYQVHGPTTDEDTLSLLRRLAAHYPDDIIAGILNRQGRKTAYGARFSAQQVGSLRRYHEIPRFVSGDESPAGELLPISQAAKTLGVAASTLHRWVNAGLVAGEQLTPGAPWRIRITEQLRNLFVDHAPPDYVSVMEAKRRLGVSRQTIWQRVKRGELEALHVRQGQHKGLRIKVVPKLSDFLGCCPVSPYVRLSIDRRRGESDRFGSVSRRKRVGNVAYVAREAEKGGLIEQGPLRKAAAEDTFLVLLQG